MTVSLALIGWWRRALWGGLCLLMAIAAVAIGAVLSPSAHDRHIGHRIEAVGGSVRYAHLGPKWMPGGVRDALCLDRIVFLKLSGATISTDVMTDIGSLRELEVCNFFGSKLPRGGIALLSQNTHLSVLDLGNSNISDDDALDLCRMSSLRELRLDYTSITDRGISGVGCLGNLVELNAFGTQITDRAMEHIGKLQNLEFLVLDYTSIGDSAISGISGLSKLTLLSLQHTCVGDMGLEGVEKLKLLKWFDLGATQVTEAAVEKLSATLPGVHVGYEWDPSQ